MGQHRLDPGFAQDVHLAGVISKAVGPEPHLMWRLFARDVERGDAGALEPRRALQQQRGLPDPRLASDEHHRTRYDAAAQHEIEFIDPGAPAAQLATSLEGGKAGRREGG